VGMVGGPDKQDAARAALAGHWVDVLVTDQLTAQRLLDF
jgi:DNA-binding transcriptional regulator LsrR (DeoR family)